MFVALAHDRRRIVHFNVTEHPTAQWTAQQVIEALPFDSAPRYLPRDGDGIFGERVQRRPTLRFQTVASNTGDFSHHSDEPKWCAVWLSQPLLGTLTMVTGTELCRALAGNATCQPGIKTNVTPRGRVLHFIEVCG